MMTPAQSRAARGLLDWTADRLAHAAEVDVATISAFEAGKPAEQSVLESIRHALETAGVEFLDDGAPGVRQRPAPKVLSVDELNASNDE